ncbi:MAG: cytochrome P450 [Deltaproteobacteria bacterium]|nr:cytochrome P450 [Deltaproteobacteria bacterium]
MADGYRDRLPPGAAREEMSHRINFLDPPQHTRVRRLVGKAFTPRRTELLRPFLISAYAHEVPSLVISELLGVPVEYRDRLTLLSDRVSRLLGTVNDQAELTDAIAAAEEMHETLRDLVKARRKQPEDDLLSDLIAVEDENERLSESELLSLAATLYSAGHRTTRDLFANGLASFLPQRDLIRAVLDGELPSAAVVEEFLRFETPTHMIARTVAEPLELRGHTLSPGEPIIVLLAAANRDPSVYTFADVFEPWRWTRRVEPAPPLSFALGAHFCLGASLARLEANIMLDVLLDTYPEMSLADETLRWHHTGVFRGLDSLPVILGARLERLPRPGSE